MRDKKTILILPRWYPNETDVQLGTFIQKQAILLSSTYNVHVIYVQASSQQNEKFRIENIRSNGIDEQIVYFKSGSKIQNASRYKKAQELAFERINAKIDLCHVHVPYRSAFLALKLKKEQNIPFVITEHWSGHLKGEYAAKNWLDKRLYKKVLSKASKISTVSSVLQSKFKLNTGFDSVVIPNLIEFSQHLEMKNPFPAGKINLLVVSDLIDEIKNFSGLLAAFQSCLDKDPNLHLNIVGGGPDEALISDLINELKLNEDITLHGRLAHDKVLPLYQFCDFLICNSNFETFGMVVAEAIAAGKPVISTKCGGPEEFVNESNGILIPIADTNALVAAIQKMSSTYKNYDAESISKMIREKYGSDTILSQLKMFYSDL